MIVGVYQPNSPGSFGQVTAFTSEAGFTPRLLSYYTGTSFAQPFPSAFAQQAAGIGASVLIQWQPRGTSNKAVAGGAEDPVIKAMAAAVKAVNRQVWVSYGQEMNGNWYDWAAKYPGAASSTAASDYVAAYRRIHDVFAAAGVTNVTWVWGPNVAYGGSYPFQAVYPGDTYVDVIGLDGYFAQPSDSFVSLFGPSITEIRAFTGKPVMVTETGVTGAAGVQQLKDLFYGMSVYGVIALVYFDQAQSGDSTHQDWRLEDNAANMAEFKTLVAQYAEKPLIRTS